MGFLFDRQTKSHLPSNATFRLTQQGTEKLQKFTGDPESRILVALETEGTCNAEEISQASQLSQGQVERIMSKLVNGGYVTLGGQVTERES